MFTGLQERLTFLTEMLQEQAGVDPGKDRYTCGYIAAVNDMLRISLDDIKEA